MKNICSDFLVWREFRKSEQRTRVEFRIRGNGSDLVNVGGETVASGCLATLPGNGEAYSISSRAASVPSSMRFVPDCLLCGLSCTSVSVVTSAEGFIPFYVIRSVADPVLYCGTAPETKNNAKEKCPDLNYPCLSPHVETNL